MPIRPLHQISPDVLKEEMVLNIAPGAYIDGQCALRPATSWYPGTGGAVVLTDVP